MGPMCISKQGGFQSYQFRQINPDALEEDAKYLELEWTVSIVSIQADQSRLMETKESLHTVCCFNRINSGRSIPTLSWNLLKYSLLNCFNRINSGRSIPTQQVQQAPVAQQRGFQSYQFRQINPDEWTEWLDEIDYYSVFQSYQFRQINPDLVNGYRWRD